MSCFCYLNRSNSVRMDSVKHKFFYETMDTSTRRLLHRLVRRIPTGKLRASLEKWEYVSEAQRRSLNHLKSKWAFTEKLLSICEENKLTVKHITELEMIHVIENPNQGMWHAFQLLNPEDDAHSVDLTHFRQQFKSQLSDIRNVSIKMKKHTDEAIWIRIAWGDALTRPNHLKPTYVVYYLQNPYVFVTSLTSKLRPLLSQALVVSTRYQGIKDAHLSGRNLMAITDLLMKRYQQVFPTKYLTPLAENNDVGQREQLQSAAKRQRLACEAFGDGVLPQLQSAVYKLKTKFKDHTNNAMSQQEEPFRCVVKFSSVSLLESLRHCASSGIASTPVTPLLSAVPLKGMNYFLITDDPGPSSQMHQTQK